MVWELFTKDAGSGDVQNLSPVSVAFAALLIVIQAVVSFYLHLDLQGQLLVAAFRCILQLSILGYILVPIFNYGQIWPVMAYVAFMIFVSAIEAVGRPSRRYNGMFLTTLMIISCCAAAIMSYATFIILKVQPWWEAQYFIPILGMVLGNTISGISVGLTATIEELASGHDRIEKLLALGGTRWEAVQQLVTHSTRLAMTPLLNQMSVVGLVSIPGMMTGQILAGEDPAQAARYQMVIMFMLGGASTMGSVVSIYACVAAVVDSCHRLQPGALLVPAHKGGVAGLIAAAAGKAYQAIGCCFGATAACFKSCCCCCCWPGKEAGRSRGDSREERASLLPREQ